ncbi:MAG: putative rane protein [Acidimicrobiales bacterium]|jgi:putative membrane protein|nr:putative rane protein [Acidimicrobiales bacterium]
MVGTVEVATNHFPGFHVHPDVIALVVVLQGWYVLALRRERARRRAAGDPGPVATPGQIRAWSAGVFLVFVAAGWPLHDLAEGYFYSAHMVQHMLLTLAVAPLLLMGTPTWLARRAVPGDRARAVLRQVCRPGVGVIQFNAILVLSHWPTVVDLTLRHHLLHLVAHAVLLLSAMAMWMVVVSPLPEVPRAKPPTQMLYLFLMTIVPTVPASFLTFNSKPLYHFYEHVPRLWGWAALSDQQVAGLLMKIVGGFDLWVVIAVVFFRWHQREERLERDAAKGDVLLWEDVEPFVTEPQVRRRV